jgi:beta-glucanase (GH16 family)
MSAIWRALATLGIAVGLSGLVGGTDASAAPSSPRPSATACGPTIMKAPGRPWRCTFVDDFNGTSLDPRKWMASTTAENGLRGQGDCWVDSPKNIAVSGGALHLTSRRVKAFSCKSAKHPSYRPTVTSGSVTTYGRFAQTYGRWDIRARFPRVMTKGSHGALWLYPQEHTYGPWPHSGEIDIAEFYSRYPDRVIPYLHYRTPFRDPTVTNNECMVADPWNFHVYTAVWLPGRIVIGIDGRICVDHRVRASRTRAATRPFDHPYTTNLTQSLGVGRNKANGGTPLPATTVIDYVRVWA